MLALCQNSVFRMLIFQKTRQLSLESVTQSFQEIFSSEPALFFLPTNVLSIDTRLKFLLTNLLQNNSSTPAFTKGYFIESVLGYFVHEDNLLINVQ